MTEQYDLKAMTAKIRALRRNAEALREIGADIPAVVKNADRILAELGVLT
ncbi:MAG: hypothetical protein N2506_08110 [Dehalococcoidales bacterium]|nr:hypothetical protein [Dehalococcoidales bacterium]